MSLVGYRRISGVCEGHKEDKSGWQSFLKHLKERGLSGHQLVVPDAFLGLVESVAELYPEAKWQRCSVHYADLRIMPIFDLKPAAMMSA